MEIVLDIDADSPMFKQLIDQVKDSVISGRLEPGLAMPSIRQLANDLGINQNTVAKAYRLLERDQVIIARGYKGTFIHQDAINHCEVNLAEQGLVLMQQTINSLRELGLTDSEIRIGFSSVMKNK